jgi:hypothetical protein
MALISPPGYEERVLGAGSNGSGKSAFFRELLEAYPRWVVIDLKGDFQPIGKYKLVRAPDDTFGWKNDRVLYRPTPQYRTRFWLEAVFRRLYNRASKVGKRQPFIVYVDETLLISKLRAVQYLAALAVAGRSLGVGLWTASQRTKWIPVEIRSEAWRWYVFFLSDEEDEKEVVKFTKGRLTIEQLREYCRQYAFVEIMRAQQGGGEIMIRPHARMPTLTPVKKPA